MWEQQMHTADDAKNVQCKTMSDVCVAFPFKKSASS